MKGIKLQQQQNQYYLNYKLLKKKFKKLKKKASRQEKEQTQTLISTIRGCISARYSGPTYHVEKPINIPTWFFDNCLLKKLQQLNVKIDKKGIIIKYFFNYRKKTSKNYIKHILNF